MAAEAEAKTTIDGFRRELSGDRSVWMGRYPDDQSWLIHFHNPANDEPETRLRLSDDAFRAVVGLRSRILSGPGHENGWRYVGELVGYAIDARMAAPFEEGAPE